MSRARGSSSGVLARGKIRVDARRAVAKLREHLLVDLHLYTLEIVRAAAAGGATQIDVRSDVDEVILTFDGAPLDEATLTRLLDHVLADAVDAEARRTRLLAMGVNAALGLSPAYVDIVSRGATEACMRVRWTPALLKPKEGDDGPAKAPDCERVQPPVGMPERGLQIVVRRKLGWGVVRQALSKALPRETMPREIELLSGATHELPVPLTLQGEPFERQARHRALVRATFDVRGAKRAAVEVLPAGAQPHAEFLEHGVRLARYVWSFEAGFPSEPSGDTALPVRVIVDAEELPTNASRSEVRSDAPLLGLVRTAALPAWIDALRGLIVVVTGTGEVPAGVEVLGRDKEELEDALASVACVVMRVAKSGAAIPDVAREVLAAPILRDCHGSKVAPSTLLQRTGQRIHLWRGRSPLDKELSLWTQDVLWERGRIADQLWSGFSTSDAKDLVELAKAGAKRRRSLLAHAPSEPALPPIEGEIARERFDVSEGRCAGLRGEVAIVPVGEEASVTVVRVFLEGRHLDTLEIDASKIPLRLEIALAWEGYLRPTPTYEGIEQNGSLRVAVWYATRIAVVALDRIAKQVGDDKERARALRAALRAAVGTHLVTQGALEIEPSPTPPITSLVGLFDAPVWPTTERGRRESLRSLREHFAEAGAICTAGPGARGRAVDGRPVVALKKRELDWLTAALAPAAFSPYDAMLLSDQELEMRGEQQMRTLELTLAEHGAHAGPAMELARPFMRGLVAPSFPARLILLHAGKPAPRAAFKASLGEVTFVIDDDTIVLKADGSGYHRAECGRLLPAIERDFCQTIVSALEGDAAAARALRSPAPLDFMRMEPALRAYLIASASALRRGAAKDEKSDATALAERIEALPMMIELNESGAPVAASLAGVQAAHQRSSSIPVLTAPPGFETLDWRPLLVPRDGPEIEALKRWSDGKASFADADVTARYGAATAERERRAFLARPALNPREVGSLGDPGGHVTVVSSPVATAGKAAGMGVTVAAALPNRYLNLTEKDDVTLVEGNDVEHAWVEILLHDRMVCQRALPALLVPVVARVNLEDQVFVDRWSELNLLGVPVVSENVHAAAIQLALDLIEWASKPGGAALLFNDARLLRLIAALLKIAAGAPPWSKAHALNEALRSEKLLWPTVQGSDVPFDALHRVNDEFYYAVCRVSAWVGPARARAELDNPLLRAPKTPEGAALLELVRALNLKHRDVTSAVLKLQGRRATARPAEAPALPGSPPHPSLRAKLATFNVSDAEGEMELIEGPASDVQLVGLDGTPRQIDADLVFPLRVLARVDAVDPSDTRARAVLKEISRAAVRHVLSLYRELDELPPFVRRNFRGIVSRIVSQKGKVSARQRKAKIFGDIAGLWHSLDDLEKDPTAEWRYTTAPPPYPARKESQPPVLQLSEKEAGYLKGAVRLVDVTGHLRRELEAQVRASAAQAASIRLDPDLAARCLRVATIDEDGMTGEIGVLAPDMAEHRRLSVFVTRRPLCVLQDGPGVPLCAAINDDSIAPNRWFDGVKSQGAVESIQQRVRAAADRALRAWLAAPVGALAVRWIEGAKEAEGGALVEVTGALWLPAEWPVHQPFVRVRTSLSAPPTMHPFIAKSASRFLRPDIPVCADLIAAPGTSWEALSAVVMREAAAMIEQAEKDGKDAAALALYQWNMGLLGSAAVRVPAERSADGKPIYLVDVLAELERSGCLWITRREGSIEGAFPSKPPAFVLLDTNSALLEVLRRRAPAALIRELGGLAAPRPARAPSVAISPVIAPALFDDDDGPSPGDAATFGAATWLERLRQRVSLLFFSGQAAAAKAPPASAFCAALQKAIDELRLDGDPITDVIEAKSGRALRYEKKTKRLVINRGHRALKWIGDSGPIGKGALSILLAAVVSEVNRALDTVTEAEERRVLQELLRAGAEVTASKEGTLLDEIEDNADRD